ncbi:MAG: GAF domain-containing protein, partial [Anaerolineales bacterium]|nr:GAF domain-containing protein [Anaerolineales bacterium]
AFTDDDVAVIQILADQLAATIERARLLQQVEQNLRELERAYGKATKDAWQSINESDVIKNAGYQFDNIRIRPINEAPELGQEAMISGSKVVKSNDSRHESVAIPIKLRGHTIGAVTVRLMEGHKNTAVKTIEQAVERLAGALESARLFEEARQRANREQSISHVTSAISAAPEFDMVLRTAVEEIGKTLGDSEVRIQISSHVEIDTD